MAEREDKTYSRRDFLKIAGVAGATVGVAAASAACWPPAARKRPPLRPGHHRGPGRSARSPQRAATRRSTTVSTGPETGRPIKLGLVSPKTGNFAVFAIADDWFVGHAQEALKGGIITADGKLREIEIVVKDTQSDSNRAAQVAGDLVQQDKVDMLLASGTPDTCNPVADQGEALGCPVLMSFAPWQACFLGAGKPAEWKWAYGNMLGSELTIRP